MAEETKQDEAPGLAGRPPGGKGRTPQRQTQKRPPLTQIPQKDEGPGRKMSQKNRENSAAPIGSCICKMKVDTHKSVGVYFFVVEYKEKDVGLWAKKEHAIESIAKMRK